MVLNISPNVWGLIALSCTNDSRPLSLTWSKLPAIATISIRIDITLGILNQCNKR